MPAKQQSHKPEELVKKMRALYGRKDKPSVAAEPVNVAMIHNWCDAMEDRNPIYYDKKIARSLGFPGIVAPPAMLNTWNMPARMNPENFSTDNPFNQCLMICEAAGYSGTVATNSDHEYLAPIPLDTQLRGVVQVTDVSDLKKTPLGTGFFITTNTEFFDAKRKLIGRMLFRVLKYQPGTGIKMPAGMRMNRRPRPAISQDTAFFWEGLKRGQLRIQHCGKCDVLQHPPVVHCPQCGNPKLGHKVAKGDATLYSYVEPHHPPLPFMRYPYVVGVVELSEGTRLITNIINCPVSKIKIGMKLKLNITQVDDELALPLFEPATPIKRDAFKRRAKTLYFEDVAVGDELPDWSLPITPTLIVGGALASRDFYEVHHDAEAAKSRGAQDIFTNIMTTQGLCIRYVNDWAGPGAMFKLLKTQLGAPNYPKDTMHITAYVSEKQQVRKSAKQGTVSVQLKGANNIGDHVNATIVLALPLKN